MYGANHIKTVSTTCFLKCQTETPKPLLSKSPRHKLSLSPQLETEKKIIEDAKNVEEYSARLGFVSSPQYERRAVTIHDNKTHDSQDATSDIGSIDLKLHPNSIFEALHVNPQKKNEINPMQRNQMANMVVPRWACEVNVGGRAGDFGARKIARNDGRPKTRDNNLLMHLRGGAGSPQLKKKMTMGLGNEMKT